MAEVHRSVQVFRDSRPLSYIDRHGNEQPLGTLSTDEYAGEGVRQLVFHPATSNTFASPSQHQKGYKLGVGGSTFGVVNPADAQRLLLDQGWEIAAQYASSGGLELTTLFRDPRREFEDPFTYDAHIWGEHGKVGSLFPMVVVSTSVYPGRQAATYSVGIYRLVCENGLYGMVAGLETFKFSHARWDMKVIAQTLQERLKPPTSIPELPPVASSRAVNTAITLLNQYQEAKVHSDELPERFKMFERQFPELSSANWANEPRQALIDQLELLRDGVVLEKGNVNNFELLNAYTNAINSYRRRNGDQGMWFRLYKQDLTVTALSTLVSFAEMFSAD